MNKVKKSDPTPGGSGRGRKKGTLNRKTEHIFEACEKHDFDPIETLILFAKGDWEALGYPSAEIERLGFGGQVAYEDRITTKDRIAACKDLIGFMYPKRKAIEISQDDGEDKGVFKLAYDTEKLKAKKDE